MAKHYKMPKHQTGRVITTKTPYGTTSDMIVEDESLLSKVELNKGQVLAKDDSGYYITCSHNVDNGLSDPFRHCEKYRQRNAINITQE